MTGPTATIVYFGTSDFAVAPLLALLGSGRFKVAAVVTQPDKAVGRKQEITASPVAKVARERGLALLQPVKLKDEAFQCAVAELEPDIFVVAAYGKILPPALLAVPRLGSLNLHGSILPRHRGASPIQAAILAGDAKTGVSLMSMDAEMDHGPVIATAELPVGSGDTHGSLENRLSGLASRLLLDNLDAVAAGAAKPREQDHAAATYTKIIDKNDGLVDWAAETAAGIERKLRAYDPWPGIFAVWQRDGQPLRLKILAARPLPEAPFGLKPGAVYVTENKTPAVATKAGALELIKVQAAGKKPAAGQDFLRGYADLAGSSFESGAAPA